MTNVISANCKIMINFRAPIKQCIIGYFKTRFLEQIFEQNRTYN